MSDLPETLSALGHSFRRVTDLDEHLWQGSLLIFEPPLDRDAQYYMMHYRPDLRRMLLINWLGYKAGLELASATIPNSSLAHGKIAIPLRWFKDNWSGKFLATGSFETTGFFAYDGTL